MDLLVASTNPHKLDELREILSPGGWHVLSLGDVAGGPFAEPVEDEPTFAGNARKKALHYAHATGRICLADDSGLEVDALDGAPGVYSARYAGVEGDRATRDAANNAKLLRELEGVADEARTARFVCAMCVCDPGGNVICESRGTFEGRIGHEPVGTHGFGYDPLLILTDPDDPLVGRTSAELSPEEKHARSHRGQAARAIAAKLRE
ncbi:MAG: XTP/dITP diphosphatase [Phycisphaerales bacterium]